MPTPGELAGTIALIALASLPLALSLWALLDCARRPAWAWALAGRRQVLWLAAILVGFLVLVGGLLIASWYLLRVRPLVAAAEDGRVP
ncbi:hypothetical protein [Rhabdothermincola sp.]|uniref:hypothetical protein n=1 Tax=Rhabdothermincola sp. TaxID=2820405 RepID=UPI002FE23961